MQGSRTRRGEVRRGRALRVLVLVAGVVAASAGGRTASVLAGVAGGHGEPLPAAWAAPNGNRANTRTARTAIDSANVGKLRTAWTAPLTGIGGGGYRYAATPLIAGNVVYTQDLTSTVTAYSEADGHVLWRHPFPGEPSPGPNGVALGSGRVYGATAHYAFALDRRSGKLVWRSATLIRNDHEGIDMAPAVSDGRVYVSTVPGNAQAFYAGGGVGTLFALDAATGKVRWRFRTAPISLWGDTQKNSGGGLWYPPALAADGSLYADIGNPAPFPDASSRPGPDLYTDSVVKLDQRTGRLLWAQQLLPHDLYDWDLQDPPVLVTVAGRPIVVAAGKMGYVYAVDARSGRLLWKTAVGIHNGHDDDSAQALGGHPPSLGDVIYPGSFGGVLTPIAVAGDTAYVPVVDLGTRWEPSETQLWDSAGGEVVAVDLATGTVRWATKLGHPVFGAATVANDLVFTTTFDGRVVALSRSDGKVVWQWQLPTGTNAPLAIAGRTLVTAASIPEGDARTQLVALTLPR